MNLLAVIVLVICMNTYGVPMFDLHDFPDWAGSSGAIMMDLKSAIFHLEHLYQMKSAASFM